MDENESLISIRANCIVQCLVGFAHLRLRSVRANVLPSVVDHLIEVEHLVVVVAVGGGVHLQC